MKNLLLITLFIFTFSGLSFGQTWSWTPNDSIRVDTAAPAYGMTYEEIFHMHNNTTDTLLCRWKRIYPTGIYNIPLQWGVSFCDPHACWGPSYINYPQNYTLMPGQNSLMQFGATPKCQADSGEVQIMTWVINDSANTCKILHFFYNITTPNCANNVGINEVEAAQISVYPNPVKSILTVNLPQVLSNAKLDVYNLLGSKVFSKELNSREREQEFDLSQLDGGIYIARISENGKVMTTRRFNKLD